MQPGEGIAPRAVALGIENLSRTCVQGRGVLVDVRRAGAGPDALVGYDALMAAIEAQGAQVAEGDFLCLYTGYGDLLMQDGEHVDRDALAARPGLDGSDQALLDWIDRSGLAAICADNPMVEKMRGVECCNGGARLPLHEHCMVKLGIQVRRHRALAGRARPGALPADRPAAEPARRRRLAGDAGRDRLARRNLKISRQPIEF